MPLSLNSIYQPLNEFFMNQFGIDAVTMVFRLEKLGPAISDKDFFGPANSYSKSVAIETFSNLVNNVPVESADGLSVTDSEIQIDDSYSAMLTGALPYVDPEVVTDVREEVLGQISSELATARRHFQQITAESSTGIMMEFKPSLAQPTDWYDQTNANNWTRQNFAIIQTDEGPVAINSQLWQMQGEPASSDAENVSIIFDCCVVRIRRPWMDTAFINSRDWYIPGKIIGELTTPSSRHINLTLLPTAMIVIKNLNIQAKWTDADRQIAANATAFGPFRITSGIVNECLTHTGMQVIGWLLERMPMLPPNAPPPTVEG
ncbi:MAG TPA: hypothetical protein VJT71_20755 [Pyrinomonadaceae bacterium]|nr:hypothetical protein [Pyrinomonadaceae bacterium]